CTSLLRLTPPHTPPPSPFLSYCHRDHPDLHSFPTRRSSDLWRGSLSGECCSHTGCPARYTSSPPPPGPGRACSTTNPGTHARRRSEEHTSELQSRENLVCRLLLEKKKKHQNDIPHSRSKRNT